MLVFLARHNTCIQLTLGSFSKTSAFQNKACTIHQTLCSPATSLECAGHRYRLQHTNEKSFLQENSATSYDCLVLITSLLFQIPESTCGRHLSVVTRLCVRITLLLYPLLVVSIFFSPSLRLTCQRTLSHDTSPPLRPHLRRHHLLPTRSQHHIHRSKCVSTTSPPTPAVTPSHRRSWRTAYQHAPNANRFSSPCTTTTTKSSTRASKGNTCSPVAFSPHQEPVHVSRPTSGVPPTKHANGSKSATTSFTRAWPLLESTP